MVQLIFFLILHLYSYAFKIIHFLKILFWSCCNRIAGVPKCWNISEYESQHSYIGAALGRVTERIKGAKFEIDGVEYKVSANDNNIHQVHGGTSGFDRVFKTRPSFFKNQITSTAQKVIFFLSFLYV